MKIYIYCIPKCLRLPLTRSMSISKILLQANSIKNVRFLVLQIQKKKCLKMTKNDPKMVPGPCMRKQYSSKLILIHTLTIFCPRVDAMTSTCHGNIVTS